MRRVSYLSVLVATGLLTSLPGCHAAPLEAEAADSAVPLAAGQTAAMEPSPANPGAEPMETEAAEAAEAGEPLEVEVFTETQALIDAVAELKGKTVVINFWATWCAPCVEEFPALVAAAERYADDGVVLVTVSQDFEDDIDSKVVPFLTEHGITDHAFQVVPNDPNEFIEQLTAAWGGSEWSGTLPATFVLNADGEPAAFVEGEQDAEAFDKLFADHLPEPAETEPAEG